jgi:hypothetical protein
MVGAASREEMMMSASISSKKVVSLNPDQKLYVIPSGGGYSCFGYDNAQRDTSHIATVLKREDLTPTADHYGTLAGYDLYRKACDAWASSINSKRTWFTPGTDPKVMKLLEQFRDDNRLIRIFLGDPKTGRDWCEENDVVGRIGRSTGSQKVPLLLAEEENWGGAILTDCVLRIMDANDRELYRHPLYQEPKLGMELETDPQMLAQGYTWSVHRDGQIQARFKSSFEASEYVCFMTGKRAMRYQDLQQALKAA